MKTRHPIALIALAGVLAAPAVHADDASCKPVSDAAVKLANTPYHEVATVDGKPFEKIYTTKTLSLRSGNKWRTMPMTPQEVLDAKRETGSSYSNCKILRTEMVNGQSATVYAAQLLSSETSFPRADNQIWIGADGRTLKTVSDAQVAGRTVHAESNLTYDNVQAPSGTK